MANAEQLSQKFLLEQLELSRRACEVLKLSYNRIKTKLPLPQDPDENLLIDLDALTARFARVSDIIMQKLFRAIDAIELTDEGTLLDRLNRAEKRGLISSAEQWRVIRMLRNQIAHEYVLQDQQELFTNTAENTPELITAFDRVIEYLKDKGLQI